MFGASSRTSGLNRYGIYFPSAYELLPIVNTNTTCFQNPGWKRTVELRLSTGGDGHFDLFDAAAWKEFGWPTQLAGNERSEFVQNRLPALLQSAKDFLCDVGSFDVDSRFDVVNFFGDDKETVCTVTITQPQNARSAFDIRAGKCLGDGTVPAWIARYENETIEERRRPAHDEHQKLVSNKDFLTYLSGFYTDLLNELKLRAVQKSAGNVEPIAKVFSDVKFIPPASPSAAGVDPISENVGNKILDQLGIPQEEIYNAVRPVQRASDLKSSPRAEAYRTFADVSRTDPKRQLWALNNAAHIYLAKKDFVSASALSKRVIEFADIPEKRAAFSESELSDLKGNAAVTAAVAADKLGNKTDANFYRNLALSNHSKKAQRLQISR
jgi:hypothetical protein